MGSKEKPVFTAKAHIFSLDPATKKDWKPVSRNAAVPLVIYHNEKKDLYRIISFTADQSVLINCSLTGQMKLTKSSSKFCQFTDSLAKTTFGLGFSSSSEQAKFKDHFETAVLSTKAKAEGTPVASQPPESADRSFPAPNSKSSSTSSLDQDGRTASSSSRSNMASPVEPKALAANEGTPLSSGAPSNGHDDVFESSSGTTTGSLTPSAVDVSRSLSLEAPGSPSRRAAPGSPAVGGLESPRRDRPNSASGKRGANLLHMSKLLTGGGSGRDVRDDPSGSEGIAWTDTSSEPSQPQQQQQQQQRPVASPADVTSSRPSSLKKEQQNTRDESPKRPAAQVGRRPSISGPSTPDVSEQLTQLKKENDQLKAALATSSSRANQWETELQRLKHNNVRLLTTLQESQSNVDEWKKQLKLYKEDNASLKTKIKDRELAEHQVVQLQQEGAEWETTARQLTEELKEVKEKLSRKEEECESLSSDMETLSTLAPKLQTANERCKVLAAAKAELTEKLAEVQDQLRMTRTASSIRLERLTDEHRTLGAALQEMLTAHSQMEQDLQ